MTMPNSRRRKFSVTNGLNGLDNCKVTHPNMTTDKLIRSTRWDTTLSRPSSTVLSSSNDFAMTTMSSANRSSIVDTENRKRDLKLTVGTAPEANVKANPSKNLIALMSASKSSSSSNNYSSKKKTITYDKGVTASSSTIDLIATANRKTNVGINKHTRNASPAKILKTRLGRQMNRDSSRKEIPRHHRVKVRSPKRPLHLTVHSLPAETSRTAQDSNDQISGSELYIDVNEDNVSDDVLDKCAVKEELVSSYSIEDMCRICHSGETLCFELGPLVSACACRGTVGRVHVRCLERWLTESGKSRCELCGTRYSTRRIHRYGVPRALVMWILSQNAKQLMVDTLGIMLMSPLAVLAAWLSGRTLAGLMMHESPTTPWPLASTFVLACMTLVCYYCWIVSAATRHALAWWIWYRSHYEVRLSTQENQE